MIILVVSLPSNNWYNEWIGVVMGVEYLWVRNVREESARGLMFNSSRFEEMLFRFCFEESGIERCHMWAEVRFKGSMHSETPKEPFTSQVNTTSSPCPSHAIERHYNKT